MRTYSPGASRRAVAETPSRPWSPPEIVQTKVVVAAGSLEAAAAESSTDWQVEVSVTLIVERRPAEDVPSMGRSWLVSASTALGSMAFPASLIIMPR
ncbi:hypothetical protein [Actinomyces radicidentis]|uniref:Uncharacterized protein n=1 Tax=Actinomyces radicidentis TaxID=111015 RepID=A0A0X8JG83_ACTRD|nr:hypothetical protein [Actinomyces radicidentis]AMD88297.1 hypothetical protein AXF14_12850 [Actinomyces radicidentis]